MDMLAKPTNFYNEIQDCILCSCTSDQPLCKYCINDISCYDLSNTNFNLSRRYDISLALPKIANDKLLAIGPHKWPLSELISLLKYGKKPLLAQSLANLFLANCFPAYRHNSKPEAILVTPMHPIKHFLRGFNQSALIAQVISDKLNIPIVKNYLAQRKISLPQVTKSAKARKLIQSDKYATIKQPLPYKHVAIFDDVITTGSTVFSVKKALLKQNPTLKVEFWSCSLSLPHQ